MNDATQRRLFEVMDISFGVEAGTVSASTTHDEIESWDSINIINLMMAIEGEFGVSLSVDDLEQMLSSEIIIDILEQKGVA